MKYRIEVRDGLIMREIDVHEYKTIHKLVTENKAYLSEFLPWAAFDTEPVDYIETLEAWQKGNGETAMMTLGVYHENHLVGLCGFNTINRMNRSTEIGYWLAESHTGKGIMTDCVTKVVEYGYNILGLNRISIIVDVENAPSIKIPERLGFVREVRMKDYFYRNERFYDGYLYRMTKLEWEALKK